MKWLIISLIIAVLLVSSCVQETSKEETEYPIFDIPNLMDKNMDEIKQILGEPYDEIKDEQDILSNYDGEMYFRKDGFELGIEHFDNKPITFDLCSEDYISLEEILEAGNLEENMITGSDVDPNDRTKYLCVNIWL